MQRAVLLLRASCLFALFLSFGCGRIEKTRECRRFASMVNRSLDAIETQVKPRTGAAYRAASLSYGALSKEVRAASKTAKPEFVANEFADVFEAASAAARSYADSVDAKDARQQEDARRELDRLARQQQGLVLRANAHCESP